MMPPQILDQIVRNVVSAWLLSQGLIPSSWDPESPDCRREYPFGHVVWTFLGQIPDEKKDTIDIDALYASLESYIANHNKAVCGVHLDIFDGLTIYKCACGCQDEWLCVKVCV